MKKTLFICLCMSLAISNFAQLGKGRILIGVDLGIANQKNTQLDTTGKESANDKSSSLSLGLKAGYFVTDHVAVGIMGGYSSRQFLRKTIQGTNEYTSDTTASSMNFGFFGRYYQMLGNSRFAAFGQLSAAFGSGGSKAETKYISNNSNTSTTTTGTNTDFNLILRPGIAFFITDMVAFETTFGGLGYFMTAQKDYDKNKRLAETTSNSGFHSTMNLNLSNILFGLTFYFGGSGDSTAK